MQEPLQNAQTSAKKQTSSQKAADTAQQRCGTAASITSSCYNIWMHGICLTNPPRESWFVMQHDLKNIIQHSQAQQQCYVYYSCPVFASFYVLGNIRLSKFNRQSLAGMITQDSERSFLYTLGISKPVTMWLSDSFFIKIPHFFIKKHLTFVSKNAALRALVDK